MRPIFIVGCGRSGTTLLRLILNRHSSIAIPEETWYFPQLAGELPRLLESDDWRERVATRVLQLNKLHFPALQPSMLEDILAKTKRSNLQDIIAVVNREFMLRYGKKRWGDKTPGYVRHLAFIKRVFPDAKIIHLVRDGRDVVPSILKYWSVGPQTHSFVETAVYWRDQVMAGIVDGPAYFGEHYKEIKYEDLVTDTVTTVQEICRFIGEDFEADMLVARQNDVTAPSWEWHIETKKEVNGRNVGKWRNLLSTHEIALVETIGGPIFQKFNYPMAANFSMSARLAFFLFNLKRSCRRVLVALKVCIYSVFREITWGTR